MSATVTAPRRAPCATTEDGLTVLGADVLNGLAEAEHLVGALMTLRSGAFEEDEQDPSAAEDDVAEYDPQPRPAPVVSLGAFREQRPQRARGKTEITIGGGE